jgi:agmatinase
MLHRFTIFGGGCIPTQYTQRTPARFIVLPLPYEKTTSYVKGTAKGPQAILEASSQVELYDEELQAEIYKPGIYTVTDVRQSSGLNFKTSPEKFVKELAHYAQRLIQPGKILVSLGGEHTITLGLVQTFKSYYRNLSVLQLDAHSDLRNEYDGTRFGHASVIRRVAELCPVVQVGIRSISEDHASIMRANLSLKTFYAYQMRLRINQAIKKILAGLKKNVYVTIDLDVFDPSYLPAVGTPEPGGLNWYEVLDILRPVFKTKHVVGFDLVELCPQPNSIISDFTAAKLAYRLMGYSAMGWLAHENKLCMTRHNDHTDLYLSRPSARMLRQGCEREYGVQQND